MKNTSYDNTVLRKLYGWWIKYTSACPPWWILIWPEFHILELSKPTSRLVINDKLRPF